MPGNNLRTRLTPTGVTDKPIPHAELYLGYGLVHINRSQMYLRYGLPYKILANPYPGYNVATMYTLQIIPNV